MQFDLKGADMYIVDGTAKVGAVNNVAGYIAGVTTVLVSGITGIIPVGNQFHFFGDPQLYTVVSTIETGLNTTSITFTPGLVLPLTNLQVINFGPNALKVVIGEGNLTYDEKRMIQYVKDRGKLDTVRLGDEDPVDVRLDFRWDFLSSVTGATIPTIEEALKRIGPASTWESSSADPCEPYAVDIQIRYTPLCTTQQKELIILPDYRWESLAHDAKAGTVSTTGKCNVTQATRTRVTNFA